MCCGLSRNAAAIWSTPLVTYYRLIVSEKQGEFSETMFVWGVLPCPRIGPFLGPEQLSAPVPATLEVLFVDGKDEEVVISFPTASSSDVPVQHLH